MQNFINPHAEKPTSFISLINVFLKNNQLIRSMIKREVIGRYRGSLIGLAWSFFNPIFMVTAYTIVFSMIFKMRWAADGIESKTQFGLILFAGIIIFNLFSEVINQSPNLILSNGNYIKKVVFPIEILSIVSIGAAVFHALISLFVLLAAFLLFNGYLHWNVIFLPLFFMPFLILLLGISWVLASIGAFVKDAGQVINLITTLLMFLSPVFYPLSAVPEKLKFFITMNPVTFIIEQTRELVIYGNNPNWVGTFIYTLISACVAWCGFYFFQKMRKGFADAI
jgi:lipopolysaccharide transport system permease protein